jgi:hypothetical protein
MGAGQGYVTRHCVLIHLHQATGGAGPTALSDVVQDGVDLLVGQSGLLQDGALALREAGLAGAAVDHADASGLAPVAEESEISMAPAAGIGALGVLAAEVFDGVHVSPSGSQQSRGTPLGRIAPSATSVIKVRSQGQTPPQNMKVERIPISAPGIREILPNHAIRY